MRMSQIKAYRLSTFGRGLDGMALMNDFFYFKNAFRPFHKIQHKKLTMERYFASSVERFS